MNINDLFDADLLAEMFRGGYVSLQNSPSGELSIMNYSPLAQYSGMWNDVTTQSRGLIVEIATGEIVARPFTKFHNYSQHMEAGLAIPEGDPVVTDKMDGSLGIIYTHNGVPAVATRGSFASDQALWATTHLRENYPNFVQPKGVTTLVEIIYPQNRIVVDYGGLEALTLLGAIDNETGADIHFNDIDWWTGPRTTNYGYRSIDEAVSIGNGLQYEQDEGVVLTWYRDGAPSVRLKVKHPRYVELHRVVTNLSTRSVWEALATGTFDQLLEVVPDEFHPWVRNIEHELWTSFDIIANIAAHDLEDARLYTGNFIDYTRAQLAKQVTQRSSYPGLVFALEDGKDIAPRIWAMIKPERSMAMIVEEV